MKTKTSFSIKTIILFLFLLTALSAFTSPYVLAGSNDVNLNVSVNITLFYINETVPVNGSTDVNISTNITAFFNQEVNSSTINESTFLLREGETSVGGAVSYHNSTYSAIFNPASSLSYSKTYTATVTEEVENVEGTKLSSDHNWTFSTPVFEGWSNLTLPEGIYVVEPGATPNGNYKYNFTLTFNGLNASNGDVLGCYINQSNCYESTLPGCRQIFVNKTLNQNVNGGNESITYVLKSEDSINTTMGGSTSIWIPWMVERCGVYEANMSPLNEENVSWRIHTHPVDWTTADIANAVNGKSLAGQYFLNTVKTDNTGDISFSVSKYNGVKIELYCHDGIDEPDEADSFIDCNDPDCRGITYSCLAKEDFDNGSYYSPSGSHGTLAANIPPGDIEENQTSSTTFNTEIDYTLHSMPNGTFKIRFRRWSLPDDMLATIIVEGLPELESVNKYAPGSDASSGLLEYFLDKNGNPVKQDSLDENETYNNSFTIKSFANNQTIRNIDTTINVSFGKPEDINMSQGHILTLKFNYVDTNGNVYEEQKNITIYFDDPTYNGGLGNRWNSTNEHENDILTTNESALTWGACNDTINSDFDYLGSGSTSFEQSSYDCYDLDCNLETGSLAWNDYTGTYTEGPCAYYNEAQTSSMCFDNYNNDWSTEDSTLGHQNTNLKLVDCRDPDCNQVSNGSVICEHDIELNCTDNFDNDMWQLKDCELTTGGHYTDAEYDCAAHCRNTIDENETGLECEDSIDNDWDMWYESGGGEYGYTENTSYYAGMDCRWIDDNPDGDCHLTNLSGGRCELGHELTCDDGFDNDFDAGQSEPDPNWNSVAYNDYFNTTYNLTYSNSADFDDYDCQNDPKVPENESINASWCFDGIDNDLDRYYYDGNWIENSSTGIDCADPDCLGVVNPADPNETCLSYEYDASDSFFQNLSEPDKYCKNSIDDDADNNLGWPHGGIDCTDPDCNKEFGICYNCPASENVTWDACADGFDNDYDMDSTKIDCEDPDCVGYLGDYDHHICVEDGNENTVALCSDGFDNDADGNTDCMDSDCNGIGICGAENCTDDLDNDGDGKIDCEDSDCYGDTACDVETDTSGSYMPPTTSSGSFGGVDATWDRRVRVGENYSVNLVYSSNYDDASLYIGNLNGDGIDNGTGLRPEDFEVIGPNASEFETTKHEYSAGGDKSNIQLYDQDHIGTNYSGFNITVEIPTNDTLDYDSFEYSHSISGSTSSSNTLEITILDDKAPVIEKVITEPGNKSLIQYDSEVWVGVKAVDQENGAPYDGTIDRCYYNVTGPDGYLKSGSDNSDCKFSFGNIVKDGNYTLTVWARDDTGNMGAANVTNYTIGLKPKYVSGTFSLSDRWYSNSSENISIEAEFDSDDAAGINNCSVYYKSSTGNLILVDNISATNAGDRITCFGNVTAPNSDNMYEIWVNITDAEGDTIKSASETFFVCQNSDSSGVGSNGEVWSCEYSDMNDDGTIDICEASGDTLAPTVSLDSPSNGVKTENKTISLIYSVSDNKGLNMNCSLYDNRTGTFSDRESRSVSAGQHSFTNTYSKNLYKWNVECTDNANNSAFATQSWTFRVIEKTEEEEKEEGGGPFGFGGGGAGEAPTEEEEKIEEDKEEGPGVIQMPEERKPIIEIEEEKIPFVIAIGILIGVILFILFTILLLYRAVEEEEE